MVDFKDLLVVADPLAELGESPTCSSSHVFAWAVELLDQEWNQVDEVVLNLAVRAVLVADGTKSQDRSFLVVEVVALQHDLQVLLDLAEHDVRIVLGKLLEGKRTGLAERRVVVLLAFGGLVVSFFISILGCALCFNVADIVLLCRHVSHAVCVLHNTTL